MRNAGITLLLILFLPLLLIACSGEDDVIVEGDAPVYTELQRVDSLEFCRTHHFWKGYRFSATDSLRLTTSVPNTAWDLDTLIVPSRTMLVVTDIAAQPNATTDTIWLQMIAVLDTVTLQGWVSEADLLTECRPTHGVARLLGIWGALADVPGGRYPDWWLDFYFHPRANPWTLGWPMALIVIGLWLLLICILAFLDRLLFFRRRYHCGHCNAPLTHPGRCPHCGRLNHL